MESNALEKPTSISVALRLFTLSTDYQNLWGYGAISLKTVRIFSKGFLDFGLDTIDK